MNRSSRYKNIKKDYQSKNLKNPFFRKKKKKGSSNKLWKCLILLILIIFAGIIWFFLASSFWCFKNININGLTRTTEEEIRNIVIAEESHKCGLLFRKNNFFLLDKDSLKKNILDKYNFANVEIKKIIPNTLEIIISERPYSFIFQQGSDYFYASSDAYVIKEIPVSPEDKEKYFILENKSDSININTKNKINLKDNYLNFVLNLSSELDNYSDLNAEKFTIDQELNSLIVKFKDGPAVYFNTKDDAKSQLEHLALVKKEKIGDNFNKTNYIDLRYGNKIFIN